MKGITHHYKVRRLSQVYSGSILRTLLCEGNRIFPVLCEIW